MEAEHSATTKCLSEYFDWKTEIRTKNKNEKRSFHFIISKQEIILV